MSCLLLLLFGPLLLELGAAIVLAVLAGIGDLLTELGDGVRLLADGERRRRTKKPRSDLLRGLERAGGGD